MNDNNNNGHANRTRAEVPKKEKTLLELVQIIIKNKFILILSIVFFLIISLIYSFTAQPKYDAQALLKKERNQETAPISGPDITSLINLQSLDEIETDIQLVTTYDVMKNVVEELDLFCTIESIKWGDERSFKLKKTFLDVSDPNFKLGNKGKFEIPEFFSISPIDTTNYFNSEYIIRKIAKNVFALIDASNYKTINKSSLPSINDTIKVENKISSGNVITLQAHNFYIQFQWDSAPINSEINFKLNNLNKAINDAVKNTSVNREGKTDIFSITYVANTAIAATVVTNMIVEKYREARLSQKKELIRYSYGFVDKQLSEVQDNLQDAENQLSSFKASGQIMTIDASSQELVQFLSSLEAEKNSTDMQLSDYRNRVSELEKELKKSGYFDQTGLGPQSNYGEGSTPFSQLMTQLSNLELQRLELLQKRTENHPDVLALDEQISLTKSKLAGFNQNTITAYKIMINTLDKKLLKITDLMSKYEVKMRGLPSQENKLAQLMRQRGTYERIYQILLDQREAMRVAELSKMQDITIVDAAQIPNKPFSPNKTMNLISGFLLGSVVGLVIILFVEIRNARFINLDDLESEYNVPILSIIPKYTKETQKELQVSKLEYKIATLVSKDEGLIETYRLFRTKLFQRLTDHKKIIMITSCEENSGKTSLTANLALSLSQEGKRILLVDCDLRKADLSRDFGLSTRDPGLIDFLTKEVNPKIYSRASKLIDILPAGGLTDDSGTILNSPRMKLLFAHLENTNYDIIIFDTPPVTRVVDPLVIAKFIKNVVLIVRPRYSLNETVRWGMQELKQANVNIIGMVANAADIENSYYYKYRYGYGYGYNSNIKSVKRKFLSLKKKSDKSIII